MFSLIINFVVMFQIHPKLPSVRATFNIYTYVIAEIIWEFFSVPVNCCLFFKSSKGLHKAASSFSKSFIGLRSTVR